MADATVPPTPAPAKPAMTPGTAATLAAAPPAPAAAKPPVAKPAAAAAPAEPVAPTKSRKLTLKDKASIQTFAWLEQRFKIRHYADGLRNFFYRINMQFPVSHTERYKLRIIWYWY